MTDNPSLIGRVVDAIDNARDASWIDTLLPATVKVDGFIYNLEYSSSWEDCLHYWRYVYTYKGTRYILTETYSSEMLWVIYRMLEFLHENGYHTTPELISGVGSEVEGGY